MTHKAEVTGVLSTVALTAGFRTDIGRKRAANEDSLLAASPVFIVADGMGGHEAGDRASAAVIAEFSLLVGRDDVTAAEIAAAVDRAHAAVRDIADGTKKGAGSTLTGFALVRHEGRSCWLVMNIGDSRVYRLFGTELVQLTVDHSVAQELVDAGALRPEDVATYPRRNVITRAVGAPESDADYWLYPVTTGERLLACSDGLSGELSDETIRAGLTLGGSTQHTADLLLGQALERGGRDNISLVVVDVLSASSPRDAALDSDGYGCEFDDVSDDTVVVRTDDTREVPGRRGRPYALRR
ncbi:PP2C family protein-serine/threonine phosphatase [Glaciibacter psychrotolerans]|uniref:Protein phosphatase n=1 Tax=Glaciibacter psychrotolerans TaxID=670054 RepID=A0A7Z0J7P0_9MICO|nr:protein phosphatase 2C domain-containing protein [Leifsonia psychrotolerans]NYJ21516.1 protein phosphatase [Leifsonia psychrotolerans]